MLSREKRRNQILQAAGGEFLAHGFSGTSMQGIAKVSGVSRASLYTYFGNKTEAFPSVLKLLEGFICREAKRAVEALEPNAPLDARMVAAFEARQTTWLAFTKTQSPYTFELVQLRAESAAQLEKAAFEQLIETMLQDAKASGEFTSQPDAPPTQDLASMLVQTTSGILLFEGDAIAKKKQLLRVMIRSLLRGLQN